MPQRLSFSLSLGLRKPGTLIQPMNTSAHTFYESLHWVDDYIQQIKPFFHLRESDSLLIKIPNQAYKINPSALKLLKALLAGENVCSIIRHFPDRETAARDIHHFFCDLKALMKGCLHEHENRLAVEKIPFQIPFNTLPVLSEIALTYQCNLACQFCYAGCGCRKETSEIELPETSVKEILKIIREEAEIPSVSFTGGEPVLREDLPELVRYAKSLGFWVNLISNGTLLSSTKVSDLKKAGLDSAQISLEGGTDKIHDRIVQREGAFRQTLSAVKALLEAGIRIHTNTTLCRLNVEHISELLMTIKNLGMSTFSMNMIMPEGSVLKKAADLMLSYSEISDLVPVIQKKANELGLEFLWYSPTPLCLFNPIAHGLGNKGCAACDGLLSVSPSGNILPCSSYPHPMGNLLKHKGNFKTLWSSEPFRFFQEKRYVHEKCLKCEDLAVCQGGCPLYWKYKGYQELEEIKS